MSSLFYRPADGYVGDVIPYFDGRTFWLYYLHQANDNHDHAKGVSWHLVTTDDFAHFREYGAVLVHGDADEQDFHAYTGSVVPANGQYHMFYTGHNQDPRFSRDGAPVQTVLHAVSKDLIHWEKLKGQVLLPNTAIYEVHDWRDPHVFFNEDRSEYWMLVAARLRAGAVNRRGCIALCTSTDLFNWSVRDPFWAPGLYFTHECPDIFRWRDRWYLVYSTFSERFVTHYRMSDSLGGPWTAPTRDTFDGRGFYAAKTAGGNQARYAFGWVPRKRGESDFGAWEWSGAMVVHKIVFEDDGALSVDIPNGIQSEFPRIVPAAASAVTGEWIVEGDRATVNAMDSFGWALGPEMPDPCLLELKVSFSAGTRGCGVILRTDKEQNAGYYLRLEPGSNRLVFDMWPRREPGKQQWEIGGDRPHQVELERPVTIRPNTEHSLRVVIEKSICVAYLDSKVALTTRIYNWPRGHLGLFVSEGTAEFTAVRIHTRE